MPLKIEIDYGINIISIFILFSEIVWFCSMLVRGLGLYFLGKPLPPHLSSSRLFLWLLCACTCACFRGICLLSIVLMLIIANQLLHSN